MDKATTQPIPHVVDIEKLERLRTYLSRSVLAENTTSGYRSDWSMFSAFCETVGRPSLPASADTLGLYVTHVLDGGRTVRTARRRAAAISHYHREAGHPSPYSPEVKLLLCGATRQRIEPPRQKEPLQVGQLREIAAALRREGTPRAARDLAILVVGFASALRRSNIVAIELQDIEFNPQGLVISIYREKQDQEGKGRLIALPRGNDALTCPAVTVGDWIGHRGTAPGRLFTRLDPGRAGLPMDAEAVAKVVKQSVALIGLDPALYGAHSLRSGFVTEAAEHGVSDTLIASHTGHRSILSLRFYYRRRRLWSGNAAAMIGL